MNDITLEARIKSAHYIASNAGSLITDLFHKKIANDEKAANDYVTELDRSIESMALKTVNEQFPEDGFYGEENMGVESKNGYLWVVDPIDGTNNYVRGLPLCGFQLAIIKDDVVVYAVVHRPLTREIYTAQLGFGAFYENQLTGDRHKLAVSQRGIQESIAIFDLQVGRADNPSTKIMNTIGNAIGSIRVFGVAVFDLPSIASGSAELLVSGIAKKYDIAAGMLLITEAGGCAYTLSGADATINDSLILFSSPSIKESILDLLQSGEVK